jgi:hypothetical protein
VDLVHQHIQCPGPPRLRGRLRLHLVPQVPQRLHQLTRRPRRPRREVNRLRTIRPFVALLKWLTTFRVGACSTRTVAVRPATSPFGFHAAAYAEDRRSRTSPSPATSGSTAAIGPRQCAPSAPSPGSRTPIEQRYDGIRSVTRTAPHNPENTSSERAARFFAAGSSEARSRAS